MEDILSFFTGLFDLVSGFFSNIGNALSFVSGFLSSSYQLLASIEAAFPPVFTHLIGSSIVIGVVLLIWPGGGGGD